MLLAFRVGEEAVGFGVGGVGEFVVGGETAVVTEGVEGGNERGGAVDFGRLVSLKRKENGKKKQ